MFEMFELERGNTKEGVKFEMFEMFELERENTKEVSNGKWLTHVN